jgi:hypothetical protein
MSVHAARFLIAGAASGGGGSRASVGMVLGLLAFAFLAASASGAEEGARENGAYGAIGIEVSRLNDSIGVIASLSGGYRVNGFRLGLKLSDLLNGPEIADARAVGGLPLRTKMHLAGLELAWSGSGGGRWNTRASLFAGVGDVSSYIGSKADAGDLSWFFALQPGVSIGPSLVWPLVPRIDFAWRILSGSATAGTDDRKLGGPSVGLTWTFP